MMKKRNEKIKRIRNYLLMLVAVLIMGLAGSGVSVHAEGTAKGQIVLSMEKFTIGQGFIIEPEYVDFYEGDNLATIFLRQLAKIGRRYNYDGRTSFGFYISEISDPDRGPVQVPDYIKTMMEKSCNPSDPKTQFHETDYTPDYLGEKDYYPQSGWMFAYNGAYPNTSASDIVPRNGDVVQWKFTLVTLGHDLDGDTKYLEANHLKALNRVRLYKLLAEVKRRPELLNDSAVKTAYDRCLSLAQNLRTSEGDLFGDMSTLKKALSWNNISDVHIYKNYQSECTVKNGTSEEKLTEDKLLPPVLSATKSDGSGISMNVTWYCPGKYDPAKAGDYAFYPVIPDEYILDDGEVLPVFTVHVRKLGDVNQDGQADEQDIQKLVKTDASGNYVYLGTSYELGDLDHDEDLCDLNADGKIDMQDYSLLIGSVSKSGVSTEDDARLVLCLDRSTCVIGDEVTAQLMLYSGDVDTIGMQFDYIQGSLKNLKLAPSQGFQIEYKKINQTGTYVMLGRRSGAVSARSLNGVCIGTLTFTCMQSGAPGLSFGIAQDLLGENAAVLGYRNGYKVTFDTSFNYGLDTRFLCQLNNGRVRNGVITDQVVYEDGIQLKLVQVAFRASDAEDANENRLRIRAQFSEGSQLVIGGSLVNGEITELFTESDGIYSADENAGCFTKGQSPEKESCDLYGLLTDRNGKKTYYKFQVVRKGYQAARWTYTEDAPFLLNIWDQNSETLTGAWNLEDLKLQGWDEDGDPVNLLVSMPSADSSQELYYVPQSASTGTLYAKHAGDYWLDITDGTGQSRGKVRITAVYPYEAADFYVKRAKEISTEYKDYDASVYSSILEYRDLLAKVEKIQENFPGNAPVYLDGLGKMTLLLTANRMKDSYGYEVYSDFLRTEAVNNLREGIVRLRSVLENNRYLPEPTVTPTPADPVLKPDVPSVTPTVAPSLEPARKVVSFAGTKVINKEFAKKSFNLRIKTNSNGKVTYKSSNPKVATVNASTGKVTMKKLGKTVISVSTAQTGEYLAGTYKVTLKLNPKKTVLGQVRSSQAKTVDVKWKKISGISGYQIQYAASKNFKGAKTIKASAKSVSGRIRKLKSRKKYYVRVRTYKKAYGQTVYSSWSKTKQVKVR